MKLPISRACCVLLLFVWAGLAHAANPIYVDTKHKLAIAGYDPVAYFKLNKAVPGDAQFQAQWKGATWQFSSLENKELFISQPEQYAPQYGGYCAYALSLNKLYKVEPDQFTVHDGKLYLNFNEETKTKWLKKPEKYIEKADRNWPTILE